jgi:hypothetical protein
MPLKVERRLKREAKEKGYKAGSDRYNRFVKK